MITIGTILIVIIITFFALAYFTRSDRLKNLFGNIATLIQTTAAVWAIFYALNESSENSTQLKNQIENQQKLIDREDAQITAQNNIFSGIKDVSGPLSSIKRNIEVIDTSFEKISSKLNEISYNFSKLNSLTEEQVEEVRREKKKGANLLIKNIECDKDTSNNNHMVNKLKIFNGGDINAELLEIKFKVLREVLTNNDVEDLGGYDYREIKIDNSSQDYITIVLNYTKSNIVVEPKKSEEVYAAFNFYCNTKKLITLNYEVISYNKNEGEKTNIGTLALECSVWKQ